MLGETTLGTWMAYGALILLLVVMVAMVVRVLSWFSLLWIAPIAEVLQRIPGFRRLTRLKASQQQNALGGIPRAPSSPF